MIIGMLKMKENFAAFTLSNPLNIPVAMVRPDLESPGKIASPCAKPIKIEVLMSIFFSGFLNFSHENRIAPVISSKNDTYKGFSVNLWAISFIKNAIMQVIKVAVITYVQV